MPEDAPIQFLPSSLPEGSCFGSEQARYNAFAAALRGFLPGSYSTFVVGNTTPAVEDQEKPWIRLTADGFLDRIYYFSDGQWLAPYEVPAGSPISMLWRGSLADLQTYDGGEAAAVTATTGPFWEEDTDMRARMPVGVGTLPISGTVVAVNGAAGLEYVTLTVANLPPHTHEVILQHGESYTGGPNNNRVGNGDANSENRPTGNSAAAQSTGGGTPHENMPPYRGRYFIKRTARVYRRAV